MAQPYRHPISGIFYCRRKVPEDLRVALGREYKKSLKTKDAAEAKARFAVAWTESDRAFALARAQGAGAETYLVDDAQQVAARWARREQERVARTDAYTEWLVENGGSAYETPDGWEEFTHYTNYADEAALLTVDEIDDIAAKTLVAALRYERLPLPVKGSGSYLRLVAAFNEHVHRLSAWALKRHNGDLAPLGVDFAPALDSGAGVAKERPPAAGHRGLQDLFELYRRDKILTAGDTRATRRTLGAYQSIVDAFIDLHGDLDVSKIDRELIARHRDELAKLPSKGAGIRALSASASIAKAAKEDLPTLSEPTIRNRLAALSAILSQGVLLAWINENPVIAGGVRRQAAKAATRRQASDRKRKDFNREELKAIFSSPAFVDLNWKPPRADFGRAWYWLPVLLFYTGARREEIAQLRVSDIKILPSHHLDILAAEGSKDGARSVKTAGSRRVIPLHQDIIARGFLRYVESLPENGPLFPKLKPDPDGYFGSNFGKRWGDYLRETVGLQGSVSPVHGFRHSFKTICREARIPEDVHDAITGHAGSGGEARKYGGMPLATMHDELKKFPTISDVLAA